VILPGPSSVTYRSKQEIEGVPPKAPIRIDLSFECDTGEEARALSEACAKVVRKAAGL
jgi:hypothetical protein